MRDTVIYPNTAISRLSTRRRRIASIGPNARLSQRRLGDRVTVRESVVIGLAVGDGVHDRSVRAPARRNARLASGVHIGNFVEIKKSDSAIA